MTLRPIAYGTGLAVVAKRDGTVIVPWRDGYHEIVIEERQGADVTRWAIYPFHGVPSCLNREGEWEYEPLPSNRDDEFYARCRFASLEDAVEFLNSASTVALNDANSAIRGEK